MLHIPVYTYCIESTNLVDKYWGESITINHCCFTVVHLPKYTFWNIYSNNLYICWGFCFLQMNWKIKKDHLEILFTLRWDEREISPQKTPWLKDQIKDFAFENKLHLPKAKLKKSMAKTLQTTLILLEKKGVALSNIQPIGANERWDFIIRYYSKFGAILGLLKELSFVLKLTLTYWRHFKGRL